MIKIKLNEVKRKTTSDEYALDPTEKYVINLDEEMEFQTATLMAFQVMGAPPALKNYHAWLYENGFNVEMPDPTNEFVASYYGVKPLWVTPYSQGVVVRAENEDDYFIVMECSNKNRGYKYAKIILTLGGCM
jgi:hypothetical protein